MSTPRRLNSDTSSATGPSENLRMTRSRVTGPTDGVTPVVKNSFTGAGGQEAPRHLRHDAPPTMNPIASTTA